MFDFMFGVMFGRIPSREEGEEEKDSEEDGGGTVVNWVSGTTVVTLSGTGTRKDSREGRGGDGAGEDGSCGCERNPGRYIEEEREGGESETARRRRFASLHAVLWVGHASRWQSGEQ